ncbi:glycosyltransferase [Deferribacter autotrophicus]|uniref:Glycosyltransferase n=1 Tax=Deferribacter autotrophicus TaxID=500465 RepID=A0A5A8F0P3_9BACT|nr:glycosyltransferase [Deferribacter autotrophicus]KAA0257638.1 glycosyltransferase [Deferribacter autotrophicus]
MIFFSFLALLVSLVLNFFIIRFSRRLKYFGVDEVDTGPQKFHHRPTPRIGGLSIFVSFMIMSILLYIKFSNMEFVYLLIASIPAFLGGILEDITKKVSAKKRLLATMFSGLLGVILLKSAIFWIDIPFYGVLKLNYWLAIILTIVGIAGVSNAVNIIDGYNGLVSVVSIIIFSGLFFVSFKVHDVFLMNTCIVMISAILGFFIWNYPYGFIFLGDGGAYFIGFIIAEISVLLVNRHPQVSVWFPLLLVIYPVFETLFSIYRKKFVRGHSPGVPDGLHLHMLIYKRIVKFMISKDNSNYLIYRNSVTSPFLWLLTSLSFFPALFFWKSNILLIIFILIFVFIYIWLYKSIVCFKVSRWFFLKEKN